MKLLRVLSFMFVSLALVGCATAPKPMMPAEKYESFAKLSSLLNQCIRQGWITPDIAASGNRFLIANVNSYNVDVDRLDKNVAWFNEYGQKVTQGDCNQMAATISSRKQTIQANNQSNAYNQQQTQEFINSTRISNTSCNRIGTQTFCSTY